MTTLPEVPGYEVERLLGEGAYCRVYLAREDVGLRRPVALKVFKDAESFEREQAMVRTIEELRRRERTAGIVQALGSGHAGGHRFIAFEWQEAGSLMDHMQREGELSLAAAVDCVTQAGRALAVLHSAGIFHRDVKPANILLGRDGGVRVADFGLSRSMGGTLSAAGSPAFAAPEVIAGRTGDGRLADVYSLGATLAYLLTGETMLPGRPDVFSMERCGVPRPVQQVVIHATAAEASERLESVEAFLVALEAAVDGAPAAIAAPRLSVAETRKRDEDIRQLVEKCGYAAAAVTMMPIPGSEILGVLPLHVALVMEIGRRYGVTIDKAGANKLLGRIMAVAGLSILGTKAATVAAKFIIPGAGGVIGAPFMYAATLGIGTVAKVHFEHGDLSDDEMRALYKEASRGAKGRFKLSRAKSDDARDMAESAVEEEAGLQESDAAAAEAPLDPVERLEVLAGLLDKGLIERDEYDAAKARIIADM